MIIMKKLTSLLIGCSLALAGAALAQQPVEQQSPSKGKHPPEKAHPAQAQPKPNAAKPQAPPATHQGATQQHGTAHDADAMKKEHGAAHEHALRMSLAQGRATKLQRTRNLRLHRKRIRMFPVNQPTRPRPLRGSSELSSGKRDEGPGRGAKDIY